jgi:hypothetical protein
MNSAAGAFRQESGHRSDARENEVTLVRIKLLEVFFNLRQIIRWDSNSQDAHIV